MFNRDMVQSFLKGTKSETRRILKTRPIIDEKAGYVYDWELTQQLDIHNWKEAFIKLFVPEKIGDIIYVRETTLELPNGKILYRADFTEDELKAVDLIWKPSMFMPKSSARLFFEIVDIQIEPVAEISEESAINEGILNFNTDPSGKAYYKDYQRKNLSFDSPIESFKSLWDSINLKPKPIFKRINGKSELIGFVSYPFDLESQSKLSHKEIMKKNLTVYTNPYIVVYKLKQTKI